MYIEKAFAQRDQFFAAVDQVASSLPPEVAEVITALGTDWDGESAVFFKVILKAEHAPDLLLKLARIPGVMACTGQVEKDSEGGICAYMSIQMTLTDDLSKYGIWDVGFQTCFYVRDFHGSYLNSLPF